MNNEKKRREGKAVLYPKYELKVLSLVNALVREKNRFVCPYCPNNIGEGREGKFVRASQVLISDLISNLLLILVPPMVKAFGKGNTQKCLRDGKFVIDKNECFAVSVKITDEKALFLLINGKEMIKKGVVL